MKATLRITVISLLLAGITWSAWQILQTDTQARKKRPPAQAPLVQVMSAEVADHPLTIQTFGTIQAAHVLTVRPQVSGQLLEMHPNFVLGGRIPAGETLYKIDPTDYEIAVKAAQAAIAQAQAEVAIEQGKRKAASKELKLLQNAIKLNAQSRALALRQPQLQQARAKLLQAQNSLEQTEVALKRTQASLPYAVIVLKRERVAGEIINAKESVGQVAQADRFQAHLHVPANIIHRLKTRTDQSAGSQIKIYQGNQVYSAEVTQISAALDSEMRMAQVIAEITQTNNIPLLIGSHIQADIAAGTLPNTIALPRSALQDNQRLWLVDADNKLQVQDIKPQYISTDTAYISPLKTGERIFLGNPAGLIPNSEVRVEIQN